MTADSETAVRRRSPWCWRWLGALAAAQLGAGLGALFPNYAFAAFDSFVWMAQKNPPHLVSGPMSMGQSIAGAFFGFVLTWIGGLVVLATSIVIKEPRPRW
jgi:hypothetical protein